jgi:hypothetical protein
VIYKGTVDSKGKSVANSISQSGPNNAVAHVGTFNHLAIVAKGQQLKLIINGTTVATVADPTYKSGQVALFVSQVAKATSNAQAAFKNLAIFNAP